MEIGRSHEDVTTEVYLCTRGTWYMFLIDLKGKIPLHIGSYELIEFNSCYVFFCPGEREKTPLHTYLSSFRVPVRTRFVSSTLVGPVCDRH